MPKPFVEHPGSAMHTHFSLFEGDRNAFHDPDDEYQLSDTGKAFLAGVLRHAPEITAVSYQWVNSYKRLVVGDEAPTTVVLGAREPLRAGPGAELLAGQVVQRRLEFRTLDSACNPYLMYAVIIAAGLKGIQKGYELPPPAEDDVWSLTEVERRAMGYQTLPQTCTSRWWRWSARSWWPRPSASTCSTSSCATSARSGRPTAGTSPVRAGDVPAGALTGPGAVDGVSLRCGRRRA